ncbi:hypothetical protein R80B4_01641 [Fibrobacteres bacterium R8-0-B4]
MLTKTCGRLIAGGVAALGLCLPAAADVVVDDFEDGRSDNVYGDYWYTFENGYDPVFGLAAFAVVDGAGTMVYSGLNGPKKGTDDGRMIAMGTTISDTGRSDWSGVTSIAFKVKGPDGLKFRFYLSTTSNSSTNWGKFGKLFKITGTGWATYSVNIPSDLTLDQYAPAITFDKTKVTKLEWAIKANDTVSAANASGTFAVDSVLLIGSIAPPAAPVTPPSTADLCGNCVSETFGPSVPSVLLTDFTTKRNALGGYGYSYSGPGSTDEEGADGRLGNGLSAAFTIAGTDADDRYAGVGFDLIDANDLEETPLNASNFNGIYFEYKTTGTGVDKIKFEVIEKAGGGGKNFYINLPGTGGGWKAAVVNFNTLVFPSWATPVRTFSKTELVKLQFAYTALGSGTIAIDNVYFLGDDKFPGQTAPPPGSAAKYALTYKVDDDNHGGVSVNGDNMFSWTDSVAAGAKGLTVTARASSNTYYFEKWDDGVTDTSRTDEAVADKVFTAIFKQKCIITYKAGENGDLLIGNAAAMVTEHTVTLAPGESGPPVTAVGRISPPYQFKSWSDGKPTSVRTDVWTDENLTFTAEFEEYVAPQVIEYVKVSYKAGAGGTLLVNDSRRIGPATIVLVPEASDSLAPGDSISVTAVPDSGYAFFRWSDNIATAMRTDKYAVGVEVHVEAIFKDTVPTVPADPDLQYFTLAYSVGKGGKIKEGSGTPVSSIIRNVAADSTGPTITAVPDTGYIFIKWSDGFADSARTDIAKSDSMLTAEFASTDTASRTYKVTYIAGAGGNLRINNSSEYVTRYDTTVTAGTDAAAIIAIADSGYKFVKWSSGDTLVQRYNTNVQADVSDTAIFELRQTDAVASSNREIPIAPTVEVTVIAPAAVIAGELTAGPNPTSAEVKFFRTGRAIKTGKLAVYDASGKLVTTISLSDKGTNGKRTVGTWNLKDSKGRQIANGSYAVKGTVTTKDGTREKVSTIITVAK